VLVVDAGDFGRAGQGDALGWPFTEFVASMQGRMNVDVWTPGERELYYGSGSLALLAAAAKGSEAVSANVAGLNGKLLFPESTVKKVGSLRVGVTGVSQISSPGVPPPAGGRYGEFRFLDPGEALRKAVARLQSRSDIVVVLAHVNAEAADSLARIIPGIDVIVVGHNPGYVAVQQAGPALLVRPANMGKQVARAHLKVSDGKIVDYKGFEDVLKENLPDEPLIARDVAAFRARHGIKDPPKVVAPPPAAGGH
jgi:2',3'-cyclic-nucleotide 2'-phosphodiesterase (5'-nucleotidase family)